MAINFYLTTTGLCVIVLKSKDDNPDHPDAVEILCVDADHHRPALSYAPKEMAPMDKSTYPDPELCVDPKGERFAMWDLSKKIVSFDFENKPAKEFTLTWGDSGKTKPDLGKPIENTWMNWIAPVQFLGLEGIRVGKDNNIPQGAAARVKLPYGTIIAQEMIKDQSDVVEWKFPGAPGGTKTRALANQLLYSVKGAKSVTVLLNGKKVLSSTATTGDLWMSLSNDMTIIPYDYNQGVKELKHLAHLEDLADPLKTVIPPKAGGDNRTGKPICNQALFVDKN